MTTEDARKLFVAGLPDSITEEVLRQLFQATGSTVIEVSLPKDRASGKTRGFGFVTLETSEQAERARSALDGSMQAGRPISVRAFQGGSGGGRRDGRAETPAAAPVASSSTEDRTLYIGNLPYDATPAEIEELLGRCGVAPVLRVHLPVGPDGRPRGFGFITLASADAVQQSLSALASADVRGRRVMVKVAHPRGTAAPGAMGARAGSSSQRGPQRPMQNDAPSGRFESANGETEPEPVHHRPAQPSGEFEDEEEGARVAAGKGKDKKRKGATAAAKRKGGAEDVRRRGGAASWQRWEDWDED